MSTQNIGLKISEFDLADNLHEDALLVIAQKDDDGVLKNYSASPETVSNFPISASEIEIKGSPFEHALKDMYGAYLPAYMKPSEFIKNMVSYEFWVNDNDITIVQDLTSTISAYQPEVYSKGVKVENYDTLYAGSYVTIKEISIPAQEYHQELRIEGLKYGYIVDGTDSDEVCFSYSTDPLRAEGEPEMDITFYGFLDMDGNQFNCTYTIKGSEVLPQKELYIGGGSLCYVMTTIKDAYTYYATLYGSNLDTEYGEVIVKTSFGNTSKSSTDPTTNTVPVQWKGDDPAYLSVKPTLTDGRGTYIMTYMFNMTPVLPYIVHHGNYTVTADILNPDNHYIDGWERKSTKYANELLTIDAKRGDRGFSVLLPGAKGLSYVLDENCGDIRITDAFAKGPVLVTPAYNGMVSSYYTAYVYNTDAPLDKDNVYKMKIESKK